jgi:uncharacterized membrane protein YbaN (DUF454 family)
LWGSSDVRGTLVYPPLIAKNTRFFLFYQVAFERSYPHLSQTFVYRNVPP